MVGSSRSLIHALDAVFDYWETTNDSSNLQTSELFKTIRAFHERHNTLQTIVQSTNIHNELYNFYNNHIKPNSDLPREILFLEILTELSPVLNEEEVQLWLKTYLRPAVDSANFDNTFVLWSRKLIDKVTCKIPSTEDEELTTRRLNIARKVMSYILEVYVGEEEVLHELIGDIKEEDKASQEYMERKRFIQSNSLNLLKNFAMEHAKLFGEVVNEKFLKVKYRGECLALISHVINTKSSRVAPIADSELFTNMYKCLVFDFNEKILQSCISIMVMLIPLVSSKVSQFISEFFVIYTRICVWDEFLQFIPDRIKVLQDQLGRDGDAWEIAKPTEGYDVYGPNYKSELNAGHLVTMIYGLFPHSLVTFAEDPSKFLEKYRPSIVDVKDLSLINFSKGSIGPRDRSALHYVEQTTKDYLKSFRLHPNFLKPERLSIDYERANPVQWLAEESSDTLGVEEIVIGCLSLNPSLMFYIPEGLPSAIFDINSLPTSNSFKSDAKPTPPTAGSRASSIGSPLLFSVESQFTQNNHFNRKLSIVPTNLIIDNRHDLRTNDLRGSEVSFKEINFNSKSDEDSERKGSDVVKDLFQTHEKLYNSKLNEDFDVPSLLSEKGLRTQPSMASVDTSKETVFSQGSILSPTLETKKIQGSVIDFYHRELLLLKNEVEFSSYMKHLNKFQYIKLKLKMDKLMKDKNQGKFKYDQLIIDHDQLVKSFEDLKTQFDEVSKSLDFEKQQLSSKFLLAQSERNELEEKVSELTNHNKQIDSQLKSLVSEIKGKNEDTVTLKNDHKVLENEYNLVLKEIEHLKINENNQVQQPAKEDFKLNEQEREIFDLKKENSMKLQKISELEQLLKETKSSLESTVKTYESKLNSNKNEIAYQLNTFSNQNDKKIQELSSTLLKYENLIEEKNLKIAQLSTSRPISIPGSSFSSEISRHPINQSSQQRNSNDNPMDFYELSNRQNSNSSGESLNNHLPYNTPPLQQPGMMKSYPMINGSSSQLTPPIIKGRGGYQKRSKRHM
ncbi:hypothetical protein CLIB1444_01S05578 [[Candida] jaroonii]|uniref:Uncharacterized protein n=1 Tax=[Candida] jaroonii TaxID=467808 RepID=A0ACA9Y0P6_9ASCO|nr:hypothetical protein CLIB1444_01S05578 [[Candida] jaroonii]